MILNSVQECQCPVYESTSCLTQGKYSIWLLFFILFTLHHSPDTWKVFLTHVFITPTSRKWNMWNGKNTVSQMRTLEF